MVHRLVKDTVVSLGDASPLLYSFNASGAGAVAPDKANESDAAHIVLDVSPYFERKLAAFACHRSQKGAWVQERPGQAGIPATLAEYVRAVSVEAFRRHWPHPDAEREDAMMGWVR
jgi:LmbE family N-acetylglucosaminyl deacetylase